MLSVGGKNMLAPIRGHSAVILSDRYDLPSGNGYGTGTQLEY
jgi:hypothetical protein